MKGTSPQYAFPEGKGSPSYAEFCPGTPAVGKYLDGLGGKYPQTFLSLFAASAGYANEMYRRETGGRGSTGLFSMIGTPDDVVKLLEKDALGGGVFESLVKKYGKSVLSDPEKTLGIFREFAGMQIDKKYDGVVSFDPDGRLLDVFSTIESTSKRYYDPKELRLAIAIKRSNGDSATKHSAALSSAGRMPDVRFVTVSEGSRHAAMGIHNSSGRSQIAVDFLFDPSTGLYGPDLLKDYIERMDGNYKEEQV